MARQFPWGGAEARKGYRRGTHRTIPPSTTVQRVRRIAPALGITRVANVTGLDTIGLPVVMVCRPNSRCLSVSQGKGLTLDSAKASGLMESVETFHAERISLPLKLATYNELRFTHDVIDPRTLLWRGTSIFHDDFRILWIEGLDLLGDRELWVPFELVHTDLSLPAPTGTGCFALSSNGLASGNYPLEAVLHALCEVVERHVYAQWLKLDRPQAAAHRLDPSSVDDPGCREALELYERAGVDVALWDLDQGLGVPVFRCSAADARLDPSRPLAACGGMGCHPDRGVALLRALTEAAQSRLTLISGSRDDLRRVRYEHLRNADVLDRWRQDFRDPTPRRFDGAPHHGSDRFDNDLRWLLERLVQAGVEHVLAFDLTKEELDIPVFRVVVPGLDGLPSMDAYLPRPVQ